MALRRRWSSGGVVIAWFAWMPTQPAAYDYLKVERGPLRVTLRESAVVEPEHRLTVTPPIPGRIDTINVANGVAVKQGQVLAWISSTDRAALMDAARAAGGKEVKFWEDIYKPAPLIAPLDGHIISTAVVPGQVVVTAQTVFTMSDHLIVQANVDETDLDQVWLGQKVDITFDSFPDAQLTGKVHEIAYDATTVNNVTTYIVNIYLDSTPDYIRSGISANVFLAISDDKNVLRIPTDAITSGGQRARRAGQGPAAGGAKDHRRRERRHLDRSALRLEGRRLDRAPHLRAQGRRTRPAFPFRCANARPAQRHSE